MTTIQINIKNVYGNEMIYPANAAAETFCKIAGKKTLSTTDIKDIRKLGFVVEIKAGSMSDGVLRAITDMIVAA